MKFKKSIALALVTGIIFSVFAQTLSVGALPVNIADISTEDVVVGPSETFDMEVTATKEAGSDQSLGAVLFSLNIPSGFSLVGVSDKGTVLGEIDPDTGAPDETVYYTAELSSDSKKVLLCVSDFTSPTATDSMTAVLTLKAPASVGTYNVTIDSVNAAGTGTASEGLNGNFNWANDEANFHISEAADKIGIVKVHNHTWSTEQYKLENGRVITYKTCNDATDPHEMVLADLENATINKSPVLESGLKIKFRVNVALGEGYEGPLYAVFEKDLYEDESDVNKKTGVQVDRIEGVIEPERLDRYTFEYKGIAAKEMCSNINVKVFGVKDGANIFLATIDYSIYEYIKNNHNNTSYNVDLRRLLVDMANYGAAAQTYFEYRTAVKPNEGIAQGLASSLPTTLTDQSVATGIKITKSPLLENVISIDWRVEKALVSSYSNMTLTTTYYETGETTPIYYTVKQSDFGQTNDTLKYSVVFDKMSAACATDRFTVELKDSNGVVIGSLKYSLLDYTANRYNSSPNSDLTKLCQQIVVYSASAKAYFV